MYLSAKCCAYVLAQNIAKYLCIQQAPSSCTLCLYTHQHFLVASFPSLHFVHWFVFSIASMHYTERKPKNKNGLGTSNQPLVWYKANTVTAGAITCRYCIMWCCQKSQPSVFGDFEAHG